MTDKSDSAFRTISEAAEEIGVPAHVLRFWETRFSQLQPLKRAGGRRYYRPADMALLRQIRALLHDNGMTIRGAQLALAGKSLPLPGNMHGHASGGANGGAGGAANGAGSSGGNGGGKGQAAEPAVTAAPAGTSAAPGIDRRALIAIRDRLAAALAA
jgi:DNA-binding transcriptional MerR regulator